MNKFLKYQWILLVHIGIMILAMLIYPLLDEVTYHYYFQLVALAWCIPPFFLLWCFKETSAKNILIIFSSFALNNLFDELFFDPEHLGWNEIAFGLITILTIFNPFKKCQIIKKFGNKSPLS